MLTKAGISNSQTQLQIVSLHRNAPAQLIVWLTLETEHCSKRLVSYHCLYRNVPHEHRWQEDNVPDLSRFHDSIPFSGWCSDERWVVSRCCIASNIGKSLIIRPVVYGGGENTSGVYATVASVFLFQGSYAIGITPLTVLYPPEVLNYSIRSNGMAAWTFAITCGG